MSGVTYGPYTLSAYPERGTFELLADAAQEAEFLHAEKGKPVRVFDENGEVAYTSKGAPDDDF